MKKLKTTDTLILISFIVAIIWGVETYKLTDFISDSNTDLLIIAFFFLTAVWNALLIYDKKTKK